MYTIQAAFRRYPSYAESLGDYVTLIRGGIQGNEEYYQDVWRSQAKNYLRSASALTGKYATDTTGKIIIFRVLIPSDNVPGMRIIVSLNWANE